MPLDCATRAVLGRASTRAVGDRRCPPEAVGAIINWRRVIWKNVNPNGSLTDDMDSGQWPRHKLVKQHAEHPARVRADKACRRNYGCPRLVPRGRHSDAERREAQRFNEEPSGKFRTHRAGFSKELEWFERADLEHGSVALP